MEASAPVVALQLYSPVDSAVHRMLLTAFAGYAEASGIPVQVLPFGRRGLRAIGAPRRAVVFVGSTGIANLLAVPLARLRGARIVYYLHEPSSLRVKRARGNGLVKSVVWQAVQRHDVGFATTVAVSRPALAERVTGTYRARPERVAVAPLLLPPPLPTGGCRTRVTYLGRLDERRHLSAFLRDAPRLAALGLRPTVLTGGGRDARALEPSDSVEVILRPDFDEALKASVLGETRMVWNPRRLDIAQSGVTADAMRYGCQVLLSPEDPMYVRLCAEGVALDWEGQVRRGYVDCARPMACGLSDVARRVFSELNGLEAFRRFYLPMLASANRG